MFIKRMVFILATVIAAAPVFGAVAEIVNGNARDKIKDQYIVVFQPDTTMQVIKTLKQDVVNLSGKILFLYNIKPLVGFAAILPTQAALDLVKKAPAVIRVEANVPATPAATIPPPFPPFPQGLDRIDQRLPGSNGNYNYNMQTGQGVHVYVFDTGIRSTHTEFDNGRVSNGCSAFDNSCNTNTNTNTNTNPNTEDCNGHGTHVAGTIGGKTYGVAKKVTLHPVRVLDCDGYGDLFSIIAGINWAMSNRIAPTVFNLSLRLTYHSDTLDDAIKASISAKITCVVAAGNLLGGNACAYSPADMADAITVGSVNPINDKRSVLSATGQCIDLFAPGVHIVSATVSGNSNNAWEEMSGTSMAAAHVSGVAALYLQKYPNKTPLQVREALRRSDDVRNDATGLQDTPNWLGIPNIDPCSPNELLHWGPYNDGFNDGDPFPERRKTTASNH